MPFYTYILQSKSTNKLYIGHTSDISDRLRRHNSNECLSTRNKGQWNLLYTKSFETRSEAMALESKLKHWKNRHRILNWIEREKNSG